MPGLLTPATSFAHMVKAVAAAGDRMHRLTCVAALKTGETIYAGSICSLDSNKQMISGCAVGSGINRPMPIFAIPSSADYDVATDVGNFAGGVISGLVATGGFEIATTEFVSETYAANDLLTAATGADKGKVRKITSAELFNATDKTQDMPIVGIVSQGAVTSKENKSLLQFWTTFQPANA